MDLGFCAGFSVTVRLAYGPTCRVRRFRLLGEVCLSKGEENGVLGAEEEEEEKRCGHVAIIGRSNVGKSTLMNRLVGEKVAIVTPKVQTTRNRIVGIAIEPPTQIIFLDTPGIFNPKVRLDRAMIDSAWGCAADADIIALMFDLPRFKSHNLELDDIHGEIRDRLSKMKSTRKTDVIMLLNKVDLMRNKKEAEETSKVLLDAFQALDPVASFMISSTRGDGIPELQSFLRDHLPVGPWLYPEDDITTLPARLIAAEVTREKIFLQLRQELPYAVAVDTIAWEEFENGSVRIDQEIYVERQSQKGIVMGKKGARIKELGIAARQDIEQILGQKVHLFLHVKVRPDWQERKEMYSPWGLNYNA